MKKIKNELMHIITEVAEHCGQDLE
jgi:hypothetical protein